MSEEPERQLPEDPNAERSAADRMDPHRSALSRRRRVGIVLLAAAVLLPVAFLAAKSILSERPNHLGPGDNGRLAGCPESPNCVSSEADDEEHFIEPLSFDGEPAAAMMRLKSVIESLPRTVIVSADDNYLHAEFTTLVFRYVDDVEFLMDADSRQIQVRSASRTGYSDLGTNRRRVEAIRTAWNAARSRTSDP